MDDPPISIVVAISVVAAAAAEHDGGAVTPAVAKVATDNVIDAINLQTKSCRDDAESDTDPDDDDDDDNDGDTNVVRSFFDRSGVPPSVVRGTPDSG